MSAFRARGGSGAGAAAVASIAAVLLAGCGATAATAATTPTTFSASHVDVALSVESRPDGRAIVARFVPDGPGLHLYGPELPRSGIDGAGRPTRVDVVGGGWTAADPPRGAVHPSPFMTALPGFWAAFPVLPDGPVTLEVPIARAGGDAGTVRVALTYMACTSDGRCFPPVIDHELDVAVP